MKPSSMFAVTRYLIPFLLLGGAIAQAAHAGTTGRTDTLTMQYGGFSRSCDPLPSNPAATVIGGNTCGGRAEVWGWEGALGVRAFVMTEGSSAAGETVYAPSPVAHVSRAARWDVASHVLPEATDIVRYRFDLDSRMAGGYGAGTWFDGDAPTARFAAVSVTATHSSCSSCRVKARRVLAGVDPTTGENEPNWQGSYRNVQHLQVLLYNLEGGNVPAGTVTLEIRAEAVVDGRADPTYAGMAEAKVGVAVRNLTATYGT